MRVQEALETMDPKDRVVLILRHFEHISSLVASQVLSISEESAKKRHSRALVRLADLMRPL